MDHRINWNNGVFAVPDEVCDYLKLASGKSLKILLYILKNKDLPADPAVIGVSTEDIEDALSYWQQTGILINEKNTCENTSSPNTEKITPHDEPSEKKVTVLAPPPEPSPADKKRAVRAASKALLPAEIAKRIEGSEEVAFLFHAAEGCLKRVLTFTDQRTILYFYDHLGMSADIIIMLIGCCCSSGRSDMKFIEETALDWNSKNITTHEQAENEILQMEKRRTFRSAVGQSLHLPDALSPTVQRYINDWSAWDMELKTVELAYDITLTNKGSVSFQYMNSILKKWHENGVKSPEEAKSFSERTKPSANKTVRPSAPMRNDRQEQRSPTGSSPSFDISLFMDKAKNSAPKL